MGRSKAMLPLGGRPLVAHAVGTLTSVDAIDTIIVVTGPDSESLRDAVGFGHGLHFVHNPLHASGEMLSSIHAALRCPLMNDADGILLALVDQPLVRSSTVARLIDAWRSAQPRPRVAQPVCHGRRGHPILLDAIGVKEILSLSSTESLKAYTTRYKSVTIEVPADDDPAVLEDIDTPADYQRLLERWAQAGR
jgi:CTP:molybdopterin cytidylyltransferase MocA